MSCSEMNSISSITALVYYIKLNFLRVNYENLKFMKCVKIKKFTGSRKFGL